MFENLIWKHILRSANLNVLVKHVFILNQHCFTYSKCIPASIYASIVFPEFFFSLSWFESAEFFDINDIFLKLGWS